jgi:hypothetical protein
MKRVLVLLFILSGLSGTALCQFSAEFDSYRDGKRYAFRLTAADFQKSPIWSDDEPNPPLSARTARSIGTEYLKTLFTVANEWRFQEIALHPVSEHWVYLIRFTTPPRPEGCTDCMSSVFTVVVKMDGVPVPATTLNSAPTSNQ